MTTQASQAEAAEPSSPSPEPPGAQLQRDFQARVAAGLEKAGHKKELDDVANSDVIEDDSVEDTDPPPKAASGAAARGRPAAAAAKDTAEAGKKPSGEGKDASAGDAGDEPGKRPQPRYDSRSFTTWIQNNPEKAAELGAKVFKVQLGANAEQWKQHFISAENGRRRHAEQVEKDRQEIEGQRAELDRLAREAREPIDDIIGVIEAEQKEDFPAIDRFIETTFKVSFNDYCARRLRGLSKETNTERAQKQRIAQLERDLAAAKGSAGKQADAGDGGKGKTPQVSLKWVESEIGEDHGVRELGDWQAKVRAAYAASYDEETDEYGLSIEDAAQEVLDSFLAKRGGSPPGKDGKQGKGAGQRPPPRQRPAPSGNQQRRETARERSQRVWTDDDEDDARTPARDLDDDTPPEDYQDRVSWALGRASKRR